MRARANKGPREIEAQPLCRACGCGMNETRDPSRHRYFDEICMGCNNDFAKGWRHRRGYDSEEYPSATDLIEYIAERLAVYAKRHDKGKSLTRCECFNRWGRCRNFWTDEIEEHQICRFHADRITKGWTPIFCEQERKDVWRKKVHELLYGDWDSVKEPAQ